LKITTETLHEPIIVQIVYTPSALRPQAGPRFKQTIPP
jgi:hypothetical protein